MMKYSCSRAGAVTWCRQCRWHFSATTRAWSRHRLLLVRRRPRNGATARHAVGCLGHQRVAAYRSAVAAVPGILAGTLKLKLKGIVGQGHRLTTTLSGCGCPTDVEDRQRWTTSLVRG